MGVTTSIIILTALISWQGFQNPEITSKLLHSPTKELREKEYYRLLTGGLVHADLTHLLINMFVLWSFGSQVESFYISKFGGLLGMLYFLLLYCGTIVLANLVTFSMHKNNWGFASLGASGGVAGILFTFILLHPWSWLLLFFIIPIPAVVMGVLYLIYESYSSNRQDLVDHTAHFYGALAGMMISLVLAPDLLNHFLRMLMQGPVSFSF